MRGNHMTGEKSGGDKFNITLDGASIESLRLAKGFGRKAPTTRHARQKCNFLLSGEFCGAKEH